MTQNQEIFSFQNLIKRLSSREHAIDCTGLSGSEKNFLIAEVFLRQRETILVIVGSRREAEQAIEDLHFFIGDLKAPILLFPSYNILPFEFLAYHNETAGQRISILYRLMETDTPSIVVTTVEGLLQKILPREEINPNMTYLSNRPRSVGVMEKCHFCLQRTRAGRLPACLEVCPVGARKFGNLLDPDSEVTQVLRTKQVFVLKQEVGTLPRFFYYFDDRYQRVTVGPDATSG